jgi:hypothetical protein
MTALINETATFFIGLFRASLRDGAGEVDGCVHLVFEAEHNQV